MAGETACPTTMNEYVSTIGGAVSPAKPFSAACILLLQHRDAGSDHFSWNQRRPVGYDFANRWFALPKAGRSGRTVEHQRNQLPREALDGALVLPPHSDAYL